MLPTMVFLYFSISLFLPDLLACLMWSEHTMRWSNKNHYRSSLYIAVITDQDGTRKGPSLYHKPKEVKWVAAWTKWVADHVSHCLAIPLIFPVPISQQTDALPTQDISFYTSNVFVLLTYQTHGSKFSYDGMFQLKNMFFKSTKKTSVHSKCFTWKKGSRHEESSAQG